MCPCFVRCCVLFASAVQLFCLVLVLSLTSAVDPAVMQLRRFTIFIDGKEAGSYRQEIRQENGLTIVQASSGFELPVFVVRYKYTFTGQETWQPDWRGNLRLQSLTSSLDDNGARRQTSVFRQGAGFQVSSNGAAASAGDPLWTTTFWTLPPPVIRDAAVQLLDLDTGTVGRVTLQMIAKEKVAGRECSRWTVRGHVTVDLWFDSEERLVQRQMTRKGRPVILRLTGIQ